MRSQAMRTPAPWSRSIWPDDRVGDGELGYVDGQLAGHWGAGHDHHAGVDGPGEVDRRAPRHQLVEREGDLGEEKVGVALPGR